MNVNFSLITMRNFLSVGNIPQTVNITNSELTLVIGYDVDDPTKKNGLGKSTILQAIFYALYGKPITQIKIPKLVNNINRKGMSVILPFEKDGVKYRIERGQKPNFLRFFINDEEFSPKKEEDADEPEQEEETDEALGENRHTQLKINSIVGISREMAQMILGLTTFNLPFIRLPTAQKKELIEELLGITQLSEKASALKLEMTATEKQIEMEETRINTLKLSNEKIQAVIDTNIRKSEAWEADKTKKIAVLFEEFLALNDIDFDQELVLFDQLDTYTSGSKDIRMLLDENQRECSRQYASIESKKKELVRLENSLLGFNDNSIKRLEKEKQRKVKENTDSEKLIADLNRERVDLEHQRDNPDQHSCQTCGQSLSGTDHLKQVVKNLISQIEKINTKIKSENKLIQNNKKEIVLIEKEIVSTRETMKNEVAQIEEKTQIILDELDQLEAEHDACNVRTHKLNQDLAALGQKPEPLFENRNEVFATKQIHSNLNRDIETERSTTNPYLNHIESMQSTLQEIDYTSINTHTFHLKHQKFLFKLLTDKNSFIRKKIVKQNLSFLNQRVAHYLDRLGLAHSVRFDDNFDVKINRLGTDYDYGQLSRGQVSRVDVSVAFAFRDVWEGLNHSINLLWIDELLDQGMDTSGINAAVGILQSFAKERKKSVFVISHRDELAANLDRVLHVMLEDDFTTFS